MEKIKKEFLVIFTAINSALGILSIPVYTLFVCNIVDYITGLAAAKYRAGEEDRRPISSARALWGIFKKISMYLLILVMYMADMMIRHSLRGMFPDFPYPDILAIFTTAWLVFNEIISILENLDDTGTPIPPFLMPVMRKIRETINIDKKDTVNIEINGKGAGTDGTEQEGN